LKIYVFPNTRSARAVWAAEEAGADYDLIRVNLTKGEGRSPAYLQINPGGKVPVLDDNGLTISESAAIVTYLGEKFPGSELIPAAGTEERAHYHRWCSFAIGELEQPLWTLAKHQFAIPEKYRVPAIRETALWEFSVAVDVLALGLGTREFILGESFSGADILLAHTLRWARGSQVSIASVALDDYADRMLARPAFKRTLEREAAV
jgi:glutathione S-transferase